MQLPVGRDDFGKIIENKLDFIDKTFFIKEILDDPYTEAIVITRPRRFGKTLNLSMLYYFLSATVHDKSTQGLFNDLNIARCGDEYMNHQGKYPVIFITLKDIKSDNFEDAYIKLYELIIDLYDTHAYLEESKKLSENQRYLYQTILKRKADKNQLENALKILTDCLYTHHNVKPWLLIDEYDSPIHAAYSNNYYDEMINFMRGLFGSVLKTNPYLHKAVITGILRIAKESLFSGVNNLEVYSLFRNEYSEYFGFTESEVNDILIKSNLVQKAEEIKAWYNGYQFGNTIIYNPWSIANCIKRKGYTEPYWINTSGNELIRDLLKKAPLSFKQEFEFLMQEGTTERMIDESMAMLDLNKHVSFIWSLLVMSGYLTPVSCESMWSGKRCVLRVPNREVNNLYRQIISSWLSNGYGLDWGNEFMQALVSGNMEVFESHLEKVLLHIVSYHDVAKEPEAFYHGLLLGAIAHLQETHEIKSNRESGLGRYDILILPKDSSQLAILMEFKAKSKEDNTSLESLAEAALKQIDEKQYAAECQSRGIKQVLKIAIAFFGKQCVLRYGKIN